MTEKTRKKNFSDLTASFIFAIRYSTDMHTLAPSSLAKDAGSRGLFILRVWQESCSSPIKSRPGNNGREMVTDSSSQLFQPDV